MPSHRDESFEAGGRVAPKKRQRTGAVQKLRPCGDTEPRASPNYPIAPVLPLGEVSEWATLKNQRQNTQLE